MRRNEKDMPDGKVEAAGMPIKRNPGLCCIWVTKSYKTFKPPAGNPGLLFELGAPERVEFWCEARPAKRAEINDSVRTGLPALQKLAVEEGRGAERALQGQVVRFEQLVENMALG